MDAPEAIVANAEYHSKLLSAISDFEYAAQAKKDQIQYIQDLEQQVEGRRKKIAQLAVKTKKERKEHESLRDSTARRFANKLVGKKEEFAQRASKEEREYVEALEQEMTERDTQKATIEMLEEGRRVLEELKDKEMRYESARAELQALYSRIFDGPSEAFPEDDRLEYDLDAAITAHDKTQASVNAQSRAAELVAKAVRSMELCQANMQEALGYSRYDMWGGGSMADMMERSALRNAQSNASQAEMLVDQARRIVPEVQPVGRVNIAQGSLMSDVFFDNIFTDMAFHSKIKESAAQVLLATNRLKTERDAARRRTDVAGSELMHAARILDARRQELDAFRRATFESYVAQNPPPPNYDTAMSPTVPVSTGPPPPMDVDSGQGSHSAPGPSQVEPGISNIDMPEPQPPTWKSRNPFAYAIAEQTRKLSM